MGELSLREDFILGANYVGPADRVWAMWDTGLFDLARMEADFARAASIGLNSLRLFVQESLLPDIERGRWERLEAVIDLAGRYGLRLILTLGDYDETLLTVLGFDGGQIADHFNAHAQILAYDLRNEPQFRDLLFAQYPGYPDPTSPALQGPTLIENYGEQVSAQAVAETRRTHSRWLPSRLTDQQAYWFANSMLIYGTFQSEATSWQAVTTGQTILQYLEQPAAKERWLPLIRLTNDALARWLAALASPVRAADPSRPLTVGYNDLFLASLPANETLDFVSFHHYQPADDSAPASSARLLEMLSIRLGLPAVLGEFGWPTSEVDDVRAAELEVATLQELRGQGLPGGLKWVLNDVAGGEHTREGSFGLFRVDGTPKSSAQRMSTP
jgi:hypothetical protein